MDLRERLQSEIDKRPGMTVRGLSLKAGLSDSALHKFMTGKVKSLTTDNLERIAAALDMSVRELWWGNADGKVTYIWDHIPEDRKAQALRVLEAFADKGEKSA